jgi:hypothetical protein
MMNFPKIKNVKTKEDYRLEVIFDNNIVKIYDCSKLLSNPIFEKLKNESFFKLAEENSCSYAIIWNDDIDLAESEIWLNGNAK